MIPVNLRGRLKTWVVTLPLDIQQAFVWYNSVWRPASISLHSSLNSLVCSAPLFPSFLHSSSTISCNIMEKGERKVLTANAGRQSIQWKLFALGGTLSSQVLETLILCPLQLVPRLCNTQWRFPTLGPLYRKNWDNIKNIFSFGWL